MRPPMVVSDTRTGSPLGCSHLALPVAAAANAGAESLHGVAPDNVISLNGPSVAPHPACWRDAPASGRGPGQVAGARSAGGLGDGGRADQCRAGDGVAVDLEAQQGSAGARAESGA